MSFKSCLLNIQQSFRHTWLFDLCSYVCGARIYGNSLAYAIRFNYFILVKYNVFRAFRLLITPLAEAFIYFKQWNLKLSRNAQQNATRTHSFWPLIESTGTWTIHHSQPFSVEIFLHFQNVSVYNRVQQNTFKIIINDRCVLLLMLIFVLVLLLYLLLLLLIIIIISWTSESATSKFHSIVYEAAWFHVCLFFELLWYRKKIRHTDNI